jgi:photosystem II stability/assembly factor-like uncharacterized protein
MEIKFVTLRCLLFGACCLAAFGALFSCRKEKIDFRVFRLQSAPVSREVAALWFADTLHGIAAGGTAWNSGFLLSTDDGGLTWRVDTLLSNRMEFVTGDRTGLAYACGMDGRAMVRFPGKTAWEIFRTEYRWMRSAAFHGERSGLIVAGEGFRDGRVFVFGPDAFWELDTIVDFPNELASVCLINPKTALAVGMGWVMRSEDAGRHWERLEITGDFFRDIQFPTPDTGYICGSSGTLLKTVDGGRNWQRIRNGGGGLSRQASFKALCFNDADSGYVVGESGLVWKTVNGGRDWTAVAGMPEDADFTDIVVLNGKGWLSAQNGRIYYFEE